MSQNKSQVGLINKNGKGLLTKKYLKNLLKKDLMKKYNQPI